MIDFGCMAVGDPACDLTIAWTLFDGDSRRAFQDGLDLDGDTWTRARGWALWKALKTYEVDLRVYPDRDRSTGRRFGWRTNAPELISQIIDDRRGSPGQ